MNDMVEVLNQETGQRGRIRRRLFENPVINNGILVEVDPTQKPYIAGMFHPRNEVPTVEHTEESPELEIPDEEDEDE